MTSDKIISRIIILKWKHFILLICGSVLLFFSHLPANAQEHPPRPISVNTIQNLSFGAFSQGGFGGTVIVSSAGLRSYTGDIILLNMGFLYFPVIFEVDANPGTLISIQNGSDVLLSGSNGGSMNLHIGDSDPVSPFVTTAVPPAKTQVNIGGTLTVGSPALNPPGNYTGTFLVTFNQE